MARTSQNPQSGGAGRRRALTRALAAGTAAVAASALAVGCAQQDGDTSATIGLAVDAPITTYNANTTDGAHTAARAVFGRVLPGLSYLGPDGSPVADRDFAVVELSQGEALTLRVQFNPDATYSDGMPVACDDLVLAWAAGSGVFTRTDDTGAVAPMFNAASDSGLADIEAVDCQAGSKEALVRFKRGRNYTDWRYLFDATTLMPAHVAARAANVPDIPAAVAARDLEAVGRVAEFWNTGWALQPGDLDLSLYPASGPYMVQSYTTEGGLVLVPNPNWFGDTPRTPRIVLWPQPQDLGAKIASRQVEVFDIGADAVPGLDLYGFDIATARSLDSEQLIFNYRGLFGSRDARIAFAACVPRQRIVEEVVRPLYRQDAEANGARLDSRVEAQASTGYPFVAATARERFVQPDLPLAGSRQEVKDATVRIGYTGPDRRREEVVSAIARSCKDAGIIVQNVSAPGFDARGAMARNEVDIVLGGDAGKPGPSGTLAALDGISVLRSGSPLNLGGFANPRIDQLIAELAVTADANRRFELAAEAEAILWDELPTLPLYEEPRTIASINELHGVVANPSAAGVGWNMDRWVKRS